MSKVLHTSARVLDRMGELLGWLPPLLARIAVGYGMAGDGWAKIHNIGNVINFFTKLNIPNPEFAARATAYSELIFGATLFIGLCSRLSTIPLIVIMITACVTSVFPDLGDHPKLFEYLLAGEFLMIVLYVWLLVRGPGAVSVDALILFFAKDTQKHEG